VNLAFSAPASKLAGDPGFGPGCYVVGPLVLGRLLHAIRNLLKWDKKSVRHAGRGDISALDRAHVQPFPCENHPWKKL